MIIHVLRKPVMGTVAQNALTHGTGALNIDGCRITTSDNLNGGAYAQKGSERNDGWRMKRDQLAGTFNQPTGRWPANLLLDEKVAAILNELGDEGGASRFFQQVKVK